MKTAPHLAMPWFPKPIWRLWRAVWLLIPLLSVWNCANLRLHNKARADIADEAARLAGEIRGSESNPFATMEANLKAAHQENLKGYELTQQLYFELFKEGFAQMDREQLREEIGNLWDDHQNTQNQLEQAMSEIARTVDRELGRQSLISQSLNEKPVVDLAGALTKVNKRLKWLEELSDFADWAERDLGGADTAPGTDADQRQAFQENLADIHGLFERSLDAEQVKQARTLQQQLSQEVLQFEARRMLEYQRFLSEVEALRRSFDFYNADYMNKLLFPVLQQIDLAKYKQICGTDPESMDAEETADGASDAASCIRDEDLLRCQQEINDSLWGPKTTVEGYLSSLLGAEFQLPSCLLDLLGSDADLIAEVKANRRNQGLEMVGAIAILVFVENPRDLASMQELALSRHLHSIKLSELNADYNMALVEKVAQSNQIYYAGGIKPEEIAEMILLTTHLAAITAIATD